MQKSISEQLEWARVSAELEAENLKLASYDHTLLDLLGDVSGRRFLDYGCGPGVLASALQRRVADISAYDISDQMRGLCGEKIGHQRVYPNIDAIPREYFDAVICNLVLCIVEEEEVRRITHTIRGILKHDGQAYIGFCNPSIFNVPESRLDLREKTGHRYEENHRYWKTKKEGGYRILEEHRSIGWYELVFAQATFEVVKKQFTPEYELKGKKIEDFIIFELKRRKEI